MKKLHLIIIALILAGFTSQHNSFAQILDTAKYKPMMLPVYTILKDTNYKENKACHFNMQSMQFDSVNISSTLTQGSGTINPSVADSINEFVKSGNQAYSFTSLQPADQLTGFPNYPISTIVKLYITFFNPANGASTYCQCTGAIIAPGYIITAGHCVKSNMDPSYAVACTVVPAYNMGSQPFGFTTATNWYSFTQWTVNGNWDYDMAILSLATPIGSTTTGWLGWGYNSNNSFFTNSANTFHSFGYPAQDDFGNTVFEGGERMYYMHGYMDFFQSSNVMCHYNIGYHGQSGSALYYKDASNNRYVYGVLSHGNGISPPYYTCHCKMDASMFNYFASIIPVGISENEYQNQVKVFPNPSDGIYTLDFGDIPFKIACVNVYNTLGAKVLNKEFDNSGTTPSIDLTLFPSGIYFINVKIDNKTVHGKLIKN